MSEINQEVNPKIMSGESYGISVEDAGKFPRSYAAIQGNPVHSQCGGVKRRRRMSKRKIKKVKKSKKKTMKRKTSKKGRKNRKSRKN